jgi:hypothetical protein
MSLYCFGKLIPKSEKDFLRPDFLSGIIDPEDVETLDGIEPLKAKGICFSVFDSIGAGEATGLWNEASNLPIDKVGESRLGTIVQRLLYDDRISIGGIAFVDGGIETVLIGSPHDCWNWFLERIKEPWDTIDNPLLIWTDDADLLRASK